MALRQKRALIIGGSIAGLFVARLLAWRGWPVRNFERVAEDTFAASHHAGLNAGPEIGIPVERRRVFAADGTIALDAVWPQTMASRASIYALLGEGLGAVMGSATLDFLQWERE